MFEKLSQFGNKVEGYDVRVINEREARAAAGILFAFGFLSFLNSFMLGNFAFTQYFVGFFMIDFLIRVINPNYSPSMLVGRMFIQNQVPEYVGADQKRFAWSIGLLLSIPMFYLVAIDPQMNPIKIVICVVCLILLMSESAFSICLGCKLYNFINRKKAILCPGGVCEIQEKDEIQKFSFTQKSIVLTALLFTSVSLYSFSVNTPNNSMAMKMMPMMLMSEEEFKKMQEQEYQKQMEKEFANEDETQYDENCIIPQHAIDMGHEDMYRERHCKKVQKEVITKKEPAVMRCGAGRCGSGKCGGGR